MSHFILGPEKKKKKMFDFLINYSVPTDDSECVEMYESHSPHYFPGSSPVVGHPEMSHPSRALPYKGI